jgi:uncharacterized protein
MAHNPVIWFEIGVQDMARAKTFYERVLNITLEPLTMPASETNSMMEMCMFPSDMNSHGASGSLVKVASLGPSNNRTVVYFSCEDCAVEEARIVAAGGRVESSKMSIGQYGFITLAKDTEGNDFGLHSLK